jgi:hypothetical protein
MLTKEADMQAAAYEEACRRKRVTATLLVQRLLNCRAAVNHADCAGVTPLFVAGLVCA